MKKYIIAPINYLLLLFLFIPCIATAQPICQIQRFSAYNGLAQRSVTDILQDSKGFMWFSTWNGLNKFDGYTFKNYKAFPGDGCTLTSNRLGKIAQTQDGDIWCQTYDERIYLFDSRREKFIDILSPYEAERQQTYIVRTVYTLPKGVSWIVCEHEAFRIDELAYKKQEGEGITFYSLKEKNLKGDRIIAVHQDSDGDEWVLTDKGISIIGKKKIESDIPFKNIKENNGNIYLLSNNNQMVIYLPKTQQLQFHEMPFPSSNNINSVHILGKDSIGLCTNEGLYIYLANEKKYRLIDPRTPTHPSPEVLSVFKDSFGELWLYSNALGVVRYNLATEDKQHYMTPKEDLPKAERANRDLIFEDQHGTLWMIPHKGGFCYYDRKSRQLKPYYTNYNNPDSKFSPVILNSFLDQQGNLWTCNHWDVTRISFFSSACSLQAMDTGSGFETRSLFINKENNLWTASKKGYVRIYLPDGSLKGYLAPEGTISREPVPFQKNIYCFMEDADGIIWMGSKLDGLFQMEKIGDDRFRIRQFTHQPDDAYSLSHNSIYSIYQDQMKHIWIGCYGGGLNLLEKTSEGEIRFIHTGNQLKGYPKEHFSKVRHITEASQAILVCTTEGLLTFASEFNQPEKIHFYQNQRTPDTVSSLSSNDVTYAYTDSRKTTYVLTFTGGVNKVLSESMLSDHIEFKPYTTKDGLPSDLVLSMIEGNDSSLWVVSENALTRFDPEKETFEYYDKKYTRQELYFTEAAPVQDQNHQLMLGTDIGILRITPEHFKKSSYAPPIVFTGFKIQGASQDLHINDMDELRLKPSERNVTFQFAALDYVDSESISYAYRLKGLEENWNEVDNSRSASYINLPPGEYELQIRSTNSDGVWMEKARVLPITVLPTFWETYWAWMLYTILFILSTATIVYIILYIYRLRHRINLEQQLTNIKLRFFTDISHELRTPLTLITSPVTEVLEHEAISANVRKHLTLVHKNTERMLHLVNQILDFRKIENKKMKVLLEKTDILSLLQKVMDNFRLIAEEKNITYQLQTSQEAICAWIDQDKFEKIVFNLLSNAFKYTPNNKSITVSVKVESEKLFISVKDEGIGIDPVKQQTLFQRFETLVKSNILQPSSGIGLSLAKELIELHSGSIEVNSQPGYGSEFTVILPMNQKVYEGREDAEFILDDGNSASAESETDKASQTGPADETVIVETTDEEDSTPPDEEEPVSILIVEDNIELRSFLSDILSSSYRIIEATNGQEGLERAQEYAPDLIISDIMMPVMDGLDMVKNIKENWEICHIPIILLSAKSSLDDRISGLEQGIDDYITKPFSATYLKTRIKSLLQQRKELQAIFWKKWSEKQEKTPKATTELIPSQPKIVSQDELFMQQVMQVMEEQMENSELTIEEFARLMNLGRSIFYQKLKSIIGLSPVDFIREIRIKRAVQLIDSGEYNFSQVAYMTGFNDPKYFGKCFKRQMGMTPSEYKEKTQH
jgi:signal transduction histidine kinase/DNA-binding response OmpR family regulator